MVGWAPAPLRRTAPLLLRRRIAPATGRRRCRRRRGRRRAPPRLLRRGHRPRRVVGEEADHLWAALGRRLRIVYSATYLAANGLRSVGTTTGVPLGFIATVIVTLVNTGCGIAKDSAFAEMFGSSGSKGAEPKAKKMPPAVFAIWFLRDLVSFTFVLTLPDVPAKKISRIDVSTARFLTPVLAQYFTTTLHLLGLSLVNLPGAPLREELKACFGEGYFSTVAARQMRIIPPYSIGGILNGLILRLGNDWIGAGAQQQQQQQSATTAPAP